uniref:Uncharacterized protein n=1 Tax=Lactuca sativa TaxID=4236 RepID=A0A9R1UYR9_LACSA|nr:hypothetical protein LSAT_V11C700357720 [Lactuca sativa]
MVALVKTTQKDHAPSGQVHTKIVMDLDTNPTPIAIKKEVHGFFAAKFHEKWPEMTKLINNLFKTLSLDQNMGLDVPITLEDVKYVIWNYGEKGHLVPMVSCSKLSNIIRKPSNTTCFFL